jgi:dTDP-4-amino-4,6-dideoxygalactose transaminase
VAELAIKGGPPVRSRPFHPWPVHDEGDEQRLLGALRSGRWAENGPLEREFEKAFAKLQGAADGVAVSNGTVSLLIALRALGIGPGDEVIVPALTWMATATTVLEAQAVPIFADVDPATLCIDAAAAEAAVTSRTAAIVPVHLYTCMADMDAVMAVARKHKLAVIEDCAHAPGAFWKGKGAGTIGELGSFSFQQSKVMTAGEGGFLLSHDKALVDKCYSLKNCGRQVEGRGAPIFGGNHRGTEWQAGVLLGQLSRFAEQHARREDALKELRRLTAGLPAVRVVADQPGVDQRPFYRVVFHYDQEAAHGIPLHMFIEAVRAEGVPIEPSYGPVYDAPLYRPDTIRGLPKCPPANRCPRAERAAYESAFMLPHPVLLGGNEDLRSVVLAFEKVIANHAEAAGLLSRTKAQVKSFYRSLRP